jgi:hypothetical protein
VKIAAGIAALLAVVCARGLVARVAGSSAAVVSRNMVVVSTTADVVSGNVSSVAALNRKPGRDGISLREALAAADATRGSETVYIFFSAALNGKTIEPRSDLPPIHRDHLVLESVAPNGSPARVTLDGRRLPRSVFAEVLLVQASDITVRWLRFTGIEGGPTTSEQAVFVQAGKVPGGPPGRQAVTNVRIEDNVFDNRGIPSGSGTHGLLVTTFGTWGVNTHFSAITIEGNTFLHYTEGVGVWTSASGVTATGAVIKGNRFDQNGYSIELSTSPMGRIVTAPRQTGGRIIGNTITGDFIGGPPGSAPAQPAISLNGTTGTIDHTLIEDNTISGVNGPAMQLGDDSNTQIINNVIRADTIAPAGIDMNVGNTTASPPSRVSAVTIENDTLVNDQPGSLLVFSPNQPGASGNHVIVHNSILYAPSGYPIDRGGRPPDVLTNSLISDPGWAGQNGNITGDPKFVDEPHGDYHLTAGSPAINAGTTIGAPSYDLDRARRDAQPDIGAFEFGATPRPLLTVTAEQLGGIGTITSSPAGINCGTTCSARFDPNTTVTLRAKPDRGSRFLGWQHGCSGKARCTIRLNSAKSITARFAP